MRVDEDGVHTPQPEEETLPFPLHTAGSEWEEFPSQLNSEWEEFPFLLNTSRTIFSQSFNQGVGIVRWTLLLSEAVFLVRIEGLASTLRIGLALQFRLKIPPQVKWVYLCTVIIRWQQWMPFTLSGAICTSHIAHAFWHCQLTTALALSVKKWNYAPWHDVCNCLTTFHCYLQLLPYQVTMIFPEQCYQ